MKPCIMVLNEFQRQGFKLDLLQHVLQICLQMSYLNKGGTFVLTKDDPPKFCVSMIKGSVFKKTELDLLPPTEIIAFADIDGAVIINQKGELLNVGQRLCPPDTTTGYFVESGRGARHNFASMYSKAVEALVFVVSEEGSISLYYSGDLRARCFSELFE